MLATAPNLLEAGAISVGFEAVRALDNIDLQVRRGEVLGLIGPNGAGKTTLTNVLTGFQSYQGSVHVDGRDVTGWSPRRLAVLGVRRSFQNVRLFESMSVADNIIAAALAAGAGRRDARRQAAEILDWCGMTAYADRRAGSLPYGLERRLGIARVMVRTPRYIMLDEPAAGLDESESDELLELLRPAPERFDCAMVVIEHDMRLIMRLCHRIHVIDHGQTLAVGTADEIRANPNVIEAYLGTSQGAHHG